MKTEDSLGRIRSLGIVSWSWVGLIVLLSIVVYALYSIYAVLMPFLYAMVLVYLLRPVVNLFDRTGVPRALALLISYLGIILLITLFGMYVGPILYNEVNGLIARIPNYVNVTNGYIQDFVSTHPALKGDDAGQFFTGLANSFKSFLQNFALSVPGMTANVFGGLLNFILAPIIAFYILKDIDVIRASLRDMLPEKHRNEGMQIIKKIDCVVGGFMKGQAMVALSVAVLSGIALYALGVDYAILLGFLIGLFNFIPYLGPILGGSVAVVVALGTSWQLAVTVIVVLLVIQQVDSVLISPRIMSQHVNLHPALVIFAILAGEALLGFIGMLVAIPIAAVGKALYLHFRERNRMEGVDDPDFCELQEPTKV